MTFVSGCVERHIDQYDKERKARTQDDQSIREFVKELSVGGVHIEGMGVVLLTTGILMASLPDEIAAALASLEALLRSL